MRSNLRTARAGFTIIEILVVTAIIAIIAAMAIPKLQSARVAADESAAIGTLRSIYAAQIQIQASRLIDTNGDGMPEYGYLGEMTGGIPARVTGAGNVPVAGAVGVDELDPSVLVSGLGAVQQSVVTRSGYIFQVFLPSATVAGAVGAIAEDVTGGKAAAPFPDPINGSLYWCAYAWPTQRGKTGVHAFFVNQDGQVMKTRGTVAAYEALTAPPAFDAAYTAPGDLSSPAASNGVVAVDGNQWDLVP
ncbi:MAG: prepilin-type N-terminal cleavage/methylation domain-containing protein [Planctomycetes bacterium]|nr:prepilin-type N-terminal cleavage/methylation domain-containing protein [Planctomycetota bacterium]